MRDNFFDDVRGLIPHEMRNNFEVEYKNATSLDFRLTSVNFDAAVTEEHYVWNMVKI